MIEPLWQELPPLLSIAAYSMSQRRATPWPEIDAQSEAVSGFRT